MSALIDFKMEERVESQLEQCLLHIYSSERCKWIVSGLNFEGAVSSKILQSGDLT